MEMQDDGAGPGGAAAGGIPQSGVSLRTTKPNWGKKPISAGVSLATKYIAARKLILCMHVCIGRQSIIFQRKVDCIRTRRISVF